MENVAKVRCMTQPVLEAGPFSGLAPHPLVCGYLSALLLLFCFVLPHFPFAGSDTMAAFIGFLVAWTGTHKQQGVLLDQIFILFYITDAHSSQKYKLQIEFEKCYFHNFIRQLFNKSAHWLYFEMFCCCDMYSLRILPNYEQDFSQVYHVHWPYSLCTFQLFISPTFSLAHILASLSLLSTFI